MAMDDNTEAVVLEVEDRTSAPVAAANQNLESVSKTAERVVDSLSRSTQAAGDVVVGMTDRSANSIKRLLDGLDRRVQTATMSPLQQLATQQQRDLGRVAGDQPAMQQVRDYYAQLSAAHERGARELAMTQSRNAAVSASRQGLAGEAAFAEALQLTQRRSNLIRDLQLRSAESQMSPAQLTLSRLTSQMAKDVGFVGPDPLKIAAVTAAYGPMIAKAKEAVEVAGAEKWRGFGEGIKEFIEHPLQTAQMAFVGFIEKIGVVGIAVGGTLVALGAVAVAGFEAAKVLGEYGTSVQNAALRTGLTTKEVEQFSFAAKLAGGDISSIERMMRGLTMALEDNSSTGDKARTALQKLGVAPRDLEGNLRPTGQILLEISEGLNRLPNNFERNKVAMDIFKRAGIEALPVLLKFAEGVGRAGELNIGSSEKTIAGYEKFHAQVVEMETMWDRLVRKMKEVIAVPVMFFLQGMMSEGSPGATIDASESGDGWITAVRRFLITGSSSGKTPLITQNAEDMLGGLQRFNAGRYASLAERAEGAAGASIVSQYLGSNSVENATARSEKAKKDYEEARTQLQGIAQSQGATTEYARQQVTHVEQLRKNYESLHETQKLIEKDQTAHIKNLETMRELVRQGEGYYRIGSGRMETIVSAQEIAKANRIRVPPSLFGREGILAPEQAVAAAAANEKRLADLSEGYGIIPGGTGQFETNPFTGFVSPQAAREKTPGLLSTGEALPGADQLKAYASGLEQRDKQRRDLEMAGLKLQEDETIRILELRTRPGGEIDAARQIAAVREKALQDELFRTGDIVRYRESSMRNEMDLRIKIAEVERQQFEGIKRDSESLLHTLFTDPSKFGSQLGRTIRDAVLKPVEEGLSTTIAQVLKPVIYGQNGQGGIAGSIRSVFGLGKPEAHISKLEQTNHIGDALLSNGALPVIITNAPQMAQQAAQAGGGGLGGGLGLAAGVGGLGMLLGGLARGGSAARPGMVTESIDYGEGAVSTGAPAIFGGPEGIGSASGILPGESAGMPTGAGGFGSIFGGLGKLFGMGGTGGGFDLGSLSTAGGLGLMMNGLMSSNRGAMSTAQTIGGASLGLARLGVMGTQLGMVGGAGVGLFADGLRRGGWGGFGEDIGGGALVGMRLGGPMGAAIGAGVGAIAGAIRMLIGGGMEKEVHDKVKSAYGVDISDQGILKQITNTIKQSFGGNVDVGIRSPQIRDLIQLYASASGQKFPTQAAGRPVNLVESGGTLYQGASSYENGQAIGYSSSLPSYGGGFTIAPPAPGYGGSVVTTVGSYNAPVTAQSLHATVASAVNSAMAHLTVQMDSKATTAVFEGKIAGGIVRNGAAVTKAQSTELRANRGRRDLTFAQLEPRTLNR